MKTTSQQGPTQLITSQITAGLTIHDTSAYAGREFAKTKLNELGNLKANIGKAEKQ